MYVQLKPSTYGAVAGLQGCVKAVSVARQVMECSPHSVLVGEGASAFARKQGFPLEEVLSPEARAEWERWKKEQQQAARAEEETETGKGEGQHDTIGLIVRDAQGNLAAGVYVSAFLVFCSLLLSLFVDALPDTSPTF